MPRHTGRGAAKQRGQDREWKRRNASDAAKNQSLDPNPLDVQLKPGAESDARATANSIRFAQRVEQIESDE